MKRIRKNEKNKVFIFVVFLILLTVFIVLSIFDFQRNMENREYNNAVDSLLKQADQGKVSVQNKLEGYINVLESVSKGLVKADIHSEETMKLLKDTSQISNLDFVRIAIANRQGLSYVTNGNKIDVSERSYFQESLKGKKVITGITESKFNETNVFVVSVPVFDSSSKVKGVLYGIMETASFQIFKGNDNLTDFQYNHVIDKEGNYIFRTKNQNVMLEGDNLFEGLSQIDIDISLDEIKEKVSTNNDVLINVKKGEDERLVYMTSIEGSDWYIVSVVTKDRIMSNANETQSDVIYLTAKIVISIGILLLIFYLYSRNEKRHIQELDDELNVMDEVFRLAVLEAEKMIFVYDVKKDVLEFMNDYSLNRGIPKIIENAAQRVNEYWGQNGNNDTVLQEINDSFKNGLDRYECEVVLEKEKVYTYKIYLTNQYDDQKNLITCVGFVEDITTQKENELMLKKEVQLRENLLVDCIGYIEVDLNEDKVIGCSQNILPPDCYDINYSTIIKLFCEKRIDKKYQEFIKNQFSCDNLIKCYDKQKGLVVEYECVDHMNDPYWVECNIRLEEQNGHIIAFEIIRDIQAKKLRELTLTKQAEIDSLTGIYNRNCGFDHISQKLNEKRDLTHLFMIMDLDNFKMINDTFGHLYGDMVLKDAVYTMKSHFRENDVICRLGGDEFVVFLDNIPFESVDRVVSSFVTKMHRFYSDDKNKIEISVSIGAVFVEAGDYSLQDLYDKADKALYYVKRNCKNSYRLYSKELENN